MFGRTLIFSLLAGAVAALTSQSAIADSIFNYDVVTTGNLTDNGGDIYGNTFVGGKLAASNSSEFGKNTSGNKVTVAGNVTGGSQIQLVGGGTLTYGGTLDHSLVSGTAVHGSVTTTSAFATEMSTDSSYFASLASNSVFTSSNATLKATPTYISGLGTTAVFNLTSSQLFNQNENLDLSASGTINTIIINVNGASDIEQGGQNFNMGNWSSYTDNIIFNFYNATTVTLTSALTGTILAPNANVTLGSGASDVYGAVYAKSLDLTAANEIRNDLYVPVTGSLHPNVPSGAPLPLSVWSGAIVLTALGVRRYRAATV
jgi:choice-of-anchor A domain-containing protein